MAGLAELDSPLMTNTASAQVLVMVPAEEYRSRSLQLAGKLRENGITTDVFLASRKMTQQYKYAETNHIPLAVYAEDDSTWTVKDLTTRQSRSFQTVEEVLEAVVKDKE